MDSAATPRVLLELLKARVKILELQRLEIKEQKDNLTQAIDNGELSGVKTEMLLDLYDGLKGTLDEIIKQTNASTERTDDFLREVEQGQ